MKGAKTALASIRREHARGRRPAIFLDFDGTLAPIVTHPSDAQLSARTKTALEALARILPVAIISGRDLPGIEARIGIPNIACAGGHGLEWTVNRKHHSKRLSKKEQEVPSAARQSLLAVASSFEGLVIEDKQHSFALNYRALSKRDASAFCAAAMQAIKRQRARLRVFDDLSTFEILPKLAWNKGACAKEILKEFDRSAKHRHLPVYLGDSATDEDAFKALRSGVTVKIGPGKTSAQYRIARSAVDGFLSALGALSSE